ncbi:MAG TPA: ribonuclease E/G [Alphaproteobacteria bacterium]|nr:ribonuclease E/G [Alphaproteobacteria bacterium]
MTKRILVDAVHPEEVRVAVAEDSRLLEFEFETFEKKQIKNNIYLGKITRVEPSLQACFVEYGGNKQGFLPFSEIHFDYYQIPTEDKETLHKMIEAEQAQQEKLEAEREQQEAQREAQREEYKKRKELHEQQKRESYKRGRIEIPVGFSEADLPDLLKAEELAKQFTLEIMGEEYYNEKYAILRPIPEINEVVPEVDEEEDEVNAEESNISRMDFYKKYKIQEVIKRNQVVLVQVLKEERGNKGATLSTYMALAGRYCVFMPNTEKGGGVSRRISSFSERKRIREIIKSFEMPKGSSIIIRTAGMEREEDDIRKDFEYVNSLWNNIRQQTLKSSAPAIIYEESDIVKRSIRDLFKGDVSEVIIEGETAFKNAYNFMDLVAPNQKEMVKHYTGKIPVFQKFRIEERLDELYDHEVKLESGGSIVITPTEALVSIDVNSGRATKERSVEDTALKTNVEAAREISRQLRLRDLAGLIVIDFIDMRELRNKKTVERELKDALKNDRAKIQIGRISAFGLLEMSRQRLHSSLIESSSQACPMCRGVGVVRSTESLALKAIRAIEAESGKKSVGEIYLRASSVIANMIRNTRKRDIENIEKADNVKIILEEEISMLPNQYEISTEKYTRSNNTNNRPNFEQASKHKHAPENPDDIDISLYQEEPAVIVRENDDNRGNIEGSEASRYNRRNNGDTGEKRYHKGGGKNRYKGRRNGFDKGDNYKRRENKYGDDNRNQNYEQRDRKDGIENNIKKFERNDGEKNSFTNQSASETLNNSSESADKSKSKLLGLWKKITG